MVLDSEFSRIAEGSHVSVYAEEFDRLWRLAKEADEIHKATLFIHYSRAQKGLSELGESEFSAALYRAAGHKISEAIKEMLDRCAMAQRIHQLTKESVGND